MHLPHLNGTISGTKGSSFQGGGLAPAYGLISLLHSSITVAAGHHFSPPRPPILPRSISRDRVCPGRLVEPLLLIAGGYG